MVSNGTGTPRVRALSAALRRVIAESHRSLREAADMLGLSHTTLSQWQTGKRVPESDDVSALLAVLGVTGRQREEIMYLARQAHDPNWLAVAVPAGQGALLECEQTATEIIDWSPMVVPGIIQSRDYTRAIVQTRPNLTPAELRELVELRVNRRHALTAEPGMYKVLIGEFAVRQPIGDSLVLLQQLRQVIDMTAEPIFDIRVIPADTGWHSGLMGPFAVFNFETAQSIVYVEHHRSSAFLYDEEVVNDYKLAGAEMRNLALTPSETVNLLTEVIDSLEKTR